MSADLHELRAKVTVETHCALQAHRRAHDVDVSELVRDILHSWALKQIHGATLLQACLKAKGVPAAARGTSGKAKDSPLTWED